MLRPREKNLVKVGINDSYSSTSRIDLFIFIFKKKERQRQREREAMVARRLLGVPRPPEPRGLSSLVASNNEQRYFLSSNAYLFVMLL